MQELSKKSAEREIAGTGEVWEGGREGVGETPNLLLPHPSLSPSCSDLSLYLARSAGRIVLSEISQFILAIMR